MLYQRYTGNPKGVEYEHSLAIPTHFDLRHDRFYGAVGYDSVCGIVPMFHAMGWGIPWVALMLGCKQVMPHRFMDPARLLDLMVTEEVTLSAGVPTIWQGVKVSLRS